MIDSFLNFDVTHKIDLTKEEFKKTLIDFFTKYENPEIAVFYFAGHGIQISGQNYLLPIDLDLERPAENVLFDGIDLNQIMRQFLPGKIRVVFLDACRDNPIESSLAGGLGKGLASINAPKNTLISFAARDGGVAIDSLNNSSNSPYTKSLLDHLGQKEDISILLRKVRDDVLKTQKEYKSHGNMDPYHQTKLY